MLGKTRMTIVFQRVLFCFDSVFLAAFKIGRFTCEFLEANTGRPTWLVQVMLHASIIILLLSAIHAIRGQLIRSRFPLKKTHCYFLGFGPPGHIPPSDFIAEKWYPSDLPTVAPPWKHPINKPQLTQVSSTVKRVESTKNSLATVPQTSTTARITTTTAPTTKPITTTTTKAPKTTTVTTTSERTTSTTPIITTTTTPSRIPSSTTKPRTTTTSILPNTTTVSLAPEATTTLLSTIELSSTTKQPSTALSTSSQTKTTISSSTTRLLPSSTELPQTTTRSRTKSKLHPLSIKLSPFFEDITANLVPKGIGLRNQNLKKQIEEANSKEEEEKVKKEREEEGEVEVPTTTTATTTTTTTIKTTTKTTTTQGTTFPTLITEEEEEFTDTTTQATTTIPIEHSKQTKLGNSKNGRKHIEKMRIKIVNNDNEADKHEGNKWVWMKISSSLLSEDIFITFKPVNVDSAKQNSDIQQPINNITKQVEFGNSFCFSF